MFALNSCFFPLLFWMKWNIKIKMDFSTKLQFSKKRTKFTKLMLWNQHYLKVCWMQLQHFHQEHMHCHKLKAWIMVKWISVLWEKKRKMKSMKSSLCFRFGCLTSIAALFISFEASKAFEHETNWKAHNNCLLVLDEDLDARASLLTSRSSRSFVRYF